MDLRLALGGMMGVGKTTVGRTLAKFLRLPFWDLDAVIEKRTGQPIPVLFEREGEQTFRRLERETLLHLIDTWPRAGILALGGGTLMDPRNREALGRAGFRVIVLTAGENTLLRRVSQDPHRPLRKKLRELLHERKSVYDQYPQVQADARVRTVAARILDSLPLLPSQRVASHPHPVYLGDRVFPSGGVLLTHPHLARSWRLPKPSLTLPPGERYKTLTSIKRLTQELLTLRVDRHQTLVVVGGGVLGDVGGLLAALFGRGMPLELVPTTLLAAVDAHIGGKSAVNVGGKNVLGLIRFPQKVQIDPRYFLTLPKSYWLEGVVELLKGLALTRRDFPDIAQQVVKDMASPSYPGAIQWIPYGVEAKLYWVRQDPYERKGIRFALNLGHTLGHALESASRFQIRHGYAVAWGILEEARIGVRLGITPPEIPETFERLWETLGVLPKDIPPDFTSFLSMDKKRKGDTLSIPLLRAWGWVESIPLTKDVFQW